MARTESVYRDTWGWNAALSALWFANNWKWFILLLAVLPGQVAGMPDVPPDRRNSYWGFVFMAGAIWAFFGPAILGGWSDRLGKRRVFLITGSLLTCVALFVLAGVERFALLAAGYLFLQISDDVIQGAYASLIPQLVPRDRQARSSAILSALNLFAQIGTAVAGLLLGSVNALGLKGHQWIYLGVAAVQIICLLLVLWAIRGLKEPFARQEGPRAPLWRGFLEPWKSMDFRWVWASRVLINLGYFLAQPYLQFFLVDMVGQRRPGETEPSFFLFGLQITGGQTAMMVVLLSLSLSGAVGALLSFRKMEKRGLKGTVVFAGLLLAPMLLLMAFLRDYTLVWMTALVFGFGLGTFLSADWALGAATVPDPEALGRDMGIWSSAVVFAQVTAGFAGSAIDGLNRSQMGLGYGAAFAVAAGFMLVGSLLVKRVQSVR
ncbi:MAG: MFS transporter [Fimbriimonadaceae bacterium]|nr:MFS transporter [Fimbriimonadaceae bacterium]